MDELTREFLIESQEGLDRMERCVTQLEEHPDDGELLSDIFRSVHTIKGTTGFLGFSRLESLAHAGENLLGLLRDGKLIATAEIISGLLELLDRLREILHSIEATESEGQGDDSAMIERLHLLQEMGQGVPASEEAALAPHPDASHAEKGKRKTRKSSKKASAAAVPSVASSIGAVRSAETGQAIEVYQPEGQTVQARTAISTADSTLRVDVELLNRMMNLVGELVLTRNQILQIVNADAHFSKLSRRLDMVTADLRESVMKARMQPVSHVFSKFPRLVRDLSHQLGKHVRLVMEGQETELDKGLLEAIKDPLTHSVRNAVDHGIEEPRLREAAGKDPEGTLCLRAYQERGHVIIEVSDDGGGLNVERIRAKALERNLITQERAAQLSGRELMQLIFLPGFSTAQSITNVSGRGVGMDVVRTNVEKIGGKVEIDSRPGKGTTLRLRIPLTLAIIPGLIIRSGDQSFALPQGAISELVHLSGEQAQTQIEWMEGAALYRLRGKLLPLVSLRDLLQQKKESDTSHAIYIAVLNVENRQFGLIIDGLSDPEEIVVKPLSSILKQIGLFSGAAILGNGEMALILDPADIATRINISLMADEDEVSSDEPAEQDDTMEYLLMQGSHEQSAIPLESVIRIERISRNRIERIGGIPVLRFEGALLPLMDMAQGENDEITVVICRDGMRYVGVTVIGVLDVAAGKPLHEAGTDVTTPDVVLLRDRVTALVHLKRIPMLLERGSLLSSDPVEILDGVVEDVIA